MPSVVTTDPAAGHDADRDPWIEAYLAHVRVERRLAARTVELYATHLAALQARAAESKLALAQVQPAHIRRWMAQMHGAGHARAHEASLAQDPEVMRYARLRAAAVEFAAGGLIDRRQPADNLQTDRVAQGMEEPSEREVLSGGVVISTHAANDKGFCDTSLFDVYRTTVQASLKGV